MGWTTVVDKPVLLQVVLVALLLAGALLSTIPLSEEIAPEDFEIQSTVIPLGKELYLRVMTFNIRHARGLDGKVNLSRIVSDIKHGDPDIVALQEVDRFHIRSRFVDQVNHFKKALNMDAYFSPSLYYYGIAEYGNVILSKYPLYNRKIDLLPGIKEERSLLSAQVKIGDYEVTLFTTHLGVLEEEREMQMPIILDKLHQVDGPAIFLGDMNMDHSHSLLQAIAEPWTKAELIHDTGTFYLGGEIDHIFAGPYVDTINAWTIQTDASDHMPVVAELRIQMGEEQDGAIEADNMEEGKQF